MTEDKRRERLRYRSWHRGTREMDLLLGSFADKHLHAFSPAQMDHYEALLQLSDPDLYNWLSGVDDAPAEVDSDLAKLLTAHKFKE